MKGQYSFQGGGKFFVLLNTIPEAQTGIKYSLSNS